jgi:hypothetical protein
MHWTQNLNIVSIAKFVELQQDADHGLDALTHLLKGQSEIERHLRGLDSLGKQYRPC